MKVRVTESPGEKLRRLVPFGVLVPDKPRHFREMAKVAWVNKDEAAYATRILRHGVCDGCSLGPRGLKDDVIPGTHLCLTRLGLLRLNTMGAMPEDAWRDVHALRQKSNRELQELGRVPYPLVRHQGEDGFRRVSWDDALDLVTDAFRATTPDRTGFFVTSRGLTNETYYAAQKLARVHGTNNVDLCSRLCHAPSVEALRETIGWGAMTCSLKDFTETDLVVLVGADIANNQPVSVKYLHHAKKRGARIVVVNPYREPGLERYWIPSLPGSAVFGTQLMDEFYQISVGGDVAFFTGVMKALVEKGLVDREYVDARTVNWEALEKDLAARDWPELEASAGLPRAEMEAFAETYGTAGKAVIVWSMGITQHVNGTDNVRALVNLALARGNIGKEGAGVVPIRGHSGVQGGGECGVDAHRFPGGAEVNAENAAHFTHLWGHDVPAEPGLRTSEMMEAAHEGRMDVLYSVGGNLHQTMPDVDYVREALERVRVRVHQDVVFNTSTLLDAGETVVVLPAATRYEQRDGGTSTSTERRVRFSPEIPGRRIGEARSEWEILRDLGKRLNGDAPFDWPTGRRLREEMAAAVPFYEGVENLEKEGDSLQWGGRILGRDGFPKMPDGRARFSVVPVPENPIPPGMLRLATRRGKQFNSMVQGNRDPFTEGDRNAILVSRVEAERLSVREGDAVVLRNDVGAYEGVVRYADLPPRHVQVYWPEGNVLLSRGTIDAESGIPDYNAFVKLEPVKA